jgi:hypothetical protein
MYGGILLLLFSKIKIMATVLVWITAFLIKTMNSCALFFDSIPFCIIDGIHLSLINLILLHVLILLVFISIEQKSYKVLMSSFALAIVIVCISICFDLQSKTNNELVIYQSAKTNVLNIITGNKCTQFSDTIPDDRLQSTLRENKIYHDVVFENDLHLTNTSLIIVNHKKILFSKDANLLNEKFINTIKPHYIWLIGSSLKENKLPRFLCEKKNIIISGKVWGKKNATCINNSYSTAKQGAFVLSLQ